MDGLGIFDRYAPDDETRDYMTRVDDGLVAAASALSWLAQKTLDLVWRNVAERQATHDYIRDIFADYRMNDEDE